MGGETGVDGQCQARDVNFSPIEEGVVEVFAEALQNPVMIPDGRSLILTGRKVTLQLTRQRELQSLLSEKGNIHSTPNSSSVETALQEKEDEFIEK